MPVTPLQVDFTAGIRRNRSRDSLGTRSGANVLWACKDWVIGRLGTPLEKRGGWSYQGSALASSPGRVRAIVDAPFNGNHSLLVVEADGTVQRATGAFSSWAIDGTTVNVGAIKQNPIFFLDNVLFPSYNGSANLAYANESTVVAFNPGGSYKPEYLEFHNNRVWGIDGETLVAGPLGTVETTTWDDLAAYDLTQPGRGMVSVGGVLLCFFDGSTLRVTGATPAGYGVTRDDITIRPYSGDVGCIDAFSICKYQGSVIWADKDGVWQSDGANLPLDLTWHGDAKDLYREFIANWTSNMRVSAGIYSDLLFVTMNNLSTNAFVDCLVCDIPRRVWYRFANFPFTCFARNSLGAPQTYAGVETVAGRVAALSGILSPSSTNYQDGDGTAIEPSFETAYYRFGMQPSRAQRLFLGYELDFLGTAATLSNQDITYTAAVTGARGNEIKVAIVTSGAGSTATVSVNDDYFVDNANTITVTIGSNTTKQSIVDAINNDSLASTYISASVPGGDAAEIGVAALLATALSGGASTSAYLTVDFATDPKPSPTFGNYASAVTVDGADIHGQEDRGYHWKPIPVRKQTPGLSVRVRQTGNTAKTSIFGLGAEATALPVSTPQ